MTEDLRAHEGPKAPRFAACLSSENQNWNTPRWFLDRLELALGRIGLDPCSNKHSVVNAKREYLPSRGEDGLALPWTGRGLVFVNPPFGREIGAWTDRCAVAALEGAEIAALVPARVDARWWHRAFVSADAVLLWRGRFEFRLRRKLTGNAPFPSSLIYWGRRAAAFSSAFAEDGIMLRNPRRTVQP